MLCKNDDDKPYCACATKSYLSNVVKTAQRMFPAAIHFVLKWSSNFLI